VRGCEDENARHDLPMSSLTGRDTPLLEPGAGESTRPPVLLVLGSVTVRDPVGGEAAVGGVRPRRLLTGLAVCAMEEVSADRLADIVWGESPPRSARANLHTYLWSLRRCLASAADGRVVIDACPGGYVLRAGPGALDWHQFRDLAAAAAGIAGSAPSAAAAQLRQALDLWRGPAAADLDGSPLWLAARIAAMDEARLTVLEQRIEADLATGRHRELAPELAGLTTAHPLREQFRACQMLALYRSGRQADALAAFHQLRHCLATELGIDPSPPLRNLYQAILRDDPGIGWPPMPGTGVAALVRPDTAQPTAVTASGSCSSARSAQPKKAASQVEPRTGTITGRIGGGTGAPPAGPSSAVAPGLPSDVTLGQRAAAEEARLFQGRRAELAQMLDLLAAPGLLPRVIQLHGPAGIGKTAFAYALARECASRSWPAVILDSRDFRHDTAWLAKAVAARCSGVWSRGCGTPLLLVFDTVEEMQDMEHDLWEVILPSMKGPVLVMLCGRRPTPAFTRPGSWQRLVDDVELPGLTEAESRGLARLHGIRDPGTVSEILAFARGNPLFLTVAAQHARTAGTGRPELSSSVTRSLIGRMTREIADPAVRQLLEAASLVRTFNQELLAAMLGRDVSGFFDALSELSVIRAVPAGLRLHDLVRDSVAADLNWRTPQACQEMRQRAYVYLAQRAQSATEAGPYVQELLHLTSGLSARARFYAPAGHPGVHVRPVCPDDLPRLTELCHTGITRFGIPPGERARQLRVDFPVARQQFAVALNDAGAITGFAYTVRLNSDSWRIAAKTRGAFFAALPEAELADIMATSPAASHVGIVTGATHLPGYDHVSLALKEALFPRALMRHTLSGHYIAYHLLTGDCLELPVIIGAGLTKRAEDIRLGGWLADEWLLRFGDGGFMGWIGEILGIAQPRPRPCALDRGIAAPGSAIASATFVARADRARAGQPWTISTTR
jgi:DNA-binding SARP family transcriptional activator